MAATQNDINNYLSDILYGQSVFMDKINIKERLGHKDMYEHRLRNTILGYYVAIMMDYFSSGTSYTSNNFYDTTEVRDIIDRINRLCDSHYDIEL